GHLRWVEVPYHVAHHVGAEDLVAVHGGVHIEGRPVIDAADGDHGEVDGRPVWLLADAEPGAELPALLDGHLGAVHVLHLNSFPQGVVAPRPIVGLSYSLIIVRYDKTDVL